MDTELTAAIDDTTGGSWIVTTQTSTYLLDLDARTVTRFPASDNSDVGDWRVAQMRGDGTVVPLVMLVRCRLGDRMRLLVDIVRDGQTVTVRETTPVVSVRPAP